MKQSIILRGRYGLTHKLERQGGRDSKTYKIVTDLNYRIGYTSDSRLFIDLSGGPFMSVGEYLPEAKATIKSIEPPLMTFW